MRMPPLILSSLLLVACHTTTPQESEVAGRYQVVFEDALYSRPLISPDLVPTLEKVFTKTLERTSFQPVATEGAGERVITVGLGCLPQLPAAERHHPSIQGLENCARGIRYTILEPGRSPRTHIVVPQDNLQTLAVQLAHALRSDLKRSD